MQAAWDIFDWILEYRDSVEISGDMCDRILGCGIPVYKEQYST